MVEEVLRRQASNPRLSFSRTETREITGDGESKQVELERSGVLDAYLEEGTWRILAASVYDRVVCRIIETYAGKQTPRPQRNLFEKKAPKPKRRRHPNQIANLVHGNQERARIAALKKNGVASDGKTESEAVP
jgi:hypothetical protein